VFDKDKRPTVSHGLSGTRAYITWDKMIQRCHNPKHNRYHIYGGRGIVVCDEWRSSFAVFYRDLGDRPDGYTLDRIDPDKGYCKDNCRWASVSEQNANKRWRGKRSVIPGVRLSSKRKWLAQICVNYKTSTLGYFDNIFDAVCARKSAELERQKFYDSNREIATK
jgi:hypothetical protein